MENTDKSKYPAVDKQVSTKDTANPEALHLLANTTEKVSENFVNPGTPAGALVKKSDMPAAEASKTGSQMLRNNLIKG